MRFGYKNLVVWQKAEELAFQVYLVTQNFPREERYGLSSQIRRASVSIAVNIAEGSGRQGKGETKQFANIALGSLAELRCLIDFSKRLNYVSEVQYRLLSDLREEVGALLWKFYLSCY